MTDLRTYPFCCQSMQCGRTECKGCRFKPVLDEFKAWVTETDAVVTDPIWCPTVYTPKARNQLHGIALFGGV